MPLSPWETKAVKHSRSQYGSPSGAEYEMKRQRKRSPFLTRLPEKKQKKTLNIQIQQLCGVVSMSFILYFVLFRWLCPSFAKCRHHGCSTETKQNTKISFYWAHVHTGETVWQAIKGTRGTKLAKKSRRGGGGWEGAELQAIEECLTPRL